MVEPIVLLICVTVAWVAWLHRPRQVPPVVMREQAVHGATPALGKWLRENDVQAARFDRGNLVEVVMRERRPDENAGDEERDEGGGELSALDKALMHLSSGRHPDHVDAEEN